MKIETKDLRMDTHPGEGAVKEKFPHSRKSSYRRVCGEFGNLRGQHNLEGKKKQKTKKKTPQNMHLTTTTSEVREVTQMLSSTTSKWGLGREAQAASLVLSLKTRPECPEGYLRKLM